MDASLDLEDVGRDGEDGPPGALAGGGDSGGSGGLLAAATWLYASVVGGGGHVGAPGSAGGAAAAGTAAGGAVAAGGAAEQRIRSSVPNLPRGHLTVAVLKDQLQLYGGAMCVDDAKARYRPPNQHLFNKSAIKRHELLAAWVRFLDTPGDQGGFDPARTLSEEERVPTRGGPRASARPRGGGVAPPAARADFPPHMEPLRFNAADLQLERWAS